MGFSRQEYWSGLPFPSPGESSQPRDRTRVSHTAGRRFNLWATREAIWKNKAIILPGQEDGKRGDLRKWSPHNLKVGRKKEEEREEGKEGRKNKEDNKGERETKRKGNKEPERKGGRKWGGKRHRCLKNSEMKNHAVWAATEYCSPFTWGTMVCLLVWTSVNKCSCTTSPAVNKQPHTRPDKSWDMNVRI